MSNSPNNSYKPSLYNGTIAWHEATSSDYEILYWDGNAITQITNNALSDSHPSLYNGTIAWFQDTARGGNKYYDIFYWDGNTIIQVTDNNTWDASPSLYDGTIVWSGEVVDKEIYYVIMNSDPFPEFFLKNICLETCLIIKTF